TFPMKHRGTFGGFRWMKTEKKYILVGQTPVPCDDVREWARWHETADKSVAVTRIGDWEVLTVFIRLDQRLAGDKSPLLSETMIFYKPAEYERMKGETLEEWEKRADNWLRLNQGTVNM